MLENVASMTESDRSDISKELKDIGARDPYWFDAAVLGQVNRPRLFWPTWQLCHATNHSANEEYGVLSHADSKRGFDYVKNPSAYRIPVDGFLDAGVTKCSSGPFPTAVRWLPRSHPPDYPRGIEDCDPATLDKWEASHYAMSPYQFKRELGVVTADGTERPPNADERERLHGFASGHTRDFTEHERISFLGNSFPCIVIAYLLASVAVGVGYLQCSAS